MQDLDHKKTWPVFIIFAVIVLGVVGYFTYKYYNDYPETEMVAVTPITKSATKTETAKPVTKTEPVTKIPVSTDEPCVKTYSNADAGIEFSYLCDWTVEVQDSTIGGKELSLNIYPNVSEKNANRITICVGGCGHGLETYEKIDGKTITANSITWEIGYFEGYDNMEPPKAKTGTLAIITNHYIGDTGYAIEAWYLKANDEIFKNGFDQIVNTFKITK